METANINLLKQIAEDVRFVKEEVVIIKDGLKDIGFEVRPEYIEKLEKIEKGRFLSRKELEEEMEN